MKKILPVSDELAEQLLEVIRHSSIRIDAWCLHMFIVLLALMSYHWGVQLSSQAAEKELIGKASYEGIMTENTADIFTTFYLLPLFGFWWVFLMLILAHMGLVVFRTTEQKSFLHSWHKLPLFIKMILPTAVIFSLYMHFQTFLNV